MQTTSSALPTWLRGRWQRVLIAMLLVGFAWAATSGTPLTSAAPPSDYVQGQPVDLEAFFKEQPIDPSAPSIEHAIPAGPIVIDGVKYPAKHITAYNGQPLYFIVDDRSSRDSLLYAYTTMAQVRDYLAATNRLPAAHQAATPQPQNLNNYSQFFGRIGYQGQERIWPVGYGIMNLEEYGWNDRISSVKAANNSSVTILAKGRNLAGVRCLIAAGRSIPNLDSCHMLNNEVSSLAVLR